MDDERRRDKTYLDEKMIKAMRLDEREDEVMGRWYENLVQGA